MRQHNALANKQAAKVGDMYYLKYLIQSRGLTVEGIARAMGITKQSMYRKINGQTEWHLQDIKIIKNLLDMADDDVMRVFGL